ncbi:hypothetical protein SOVF_153890 [Spinacia oleracea]|uniref:Calmodulin-binding domain-containing protein n=1 Tax=Spinacia oleracea TaxID=3562 RepID=A0A9R0K743_SPIOL|nr:uncharacterized protein LOC110799988 [Spinacia oleracea]KNA09404.1 hypothetical protein SOVF_153890 [Spinacia oleracea]
MDTNLEPPNSTSTSTTTVNGSGFLSPPSPTTLDEGDDDEFYVDDSNCSTPYVSAPSSPGRSYYPSGFFYSAPASPMHFVLATAQARSSAGGGLIPATSDASSSNGSFEFEFSARFDSPAPEIGPAMSSADELFLNGQIRPMKLCAHLQRPQRLPSLTLLESEREDEEDDEFDDDGKSNVFQRSRLRNRSQRRRARSLSPLRSTVPLEWYSSEDVVSTPKKAAGENEDGDEGGEKEKDGGTESEATPSGSSSRCSSAGRSSKRWVFLKDFLRSKSEGRSNNKFWHNINMSFSPAKEKREKGNGNGNVNANENANAASYSEDKKSKKKELPAAKGKGGAAGKRRSAHEVHYAANRAQAEEMRKKTFLPYRQGLLGCLGFNSKSYGALNGFARALNPVSSR